MNLRDFIVYWNNKYQFDYWYRTRYKIGFNSSEHRSLRVMDVRMEYLEEKLIEQQNIKSYNSNRRKDVYDKKGLWLKEREVDEKTQKDLFDKIKI